ncbi:hypothetical protein PN628_20270 [Parabacteroides distasonis]|nr:hypothetical protein [Parabacteroides distasonis]MDB9153820.1 hypothetical protein [Parabacteroides distasonis]MDB9158457.1 hypothetical protein [Parabacteroides distasonis]MDB9167208.1 hypothetical protein [Parabacteroides distasonis]MDB9171744.1 hypothetical protein [Parabacteroides distasonis]MDB9196119.1 hypothetical protein [Parabacteroides distasonis]
MYPLGAGRSPTDEFERKIEHDTVYFTPPSIAGDNIILVDGENSGEVFTVPQDGYMGSTFKWLWLSSVMWKPYVLAFILFYKEELTLLLSAHSFKAFVYNSLSSLFSVLLFIITFASESKCVYHTL